MQQNPSKTETIAQKSTFKMLLADFGQLVKFRLTMLAVFSAAIGYVAAAAATGISLGTLSIVVLGGFMLSGGASIFNQVLEKDYDKLMDRTKNRPIAADRVSISNGVLLAGGLSITGGTLLAMINPVCGFLGMLSLVSYAFVYTPMKRSGVIAVAVGAIPGALPAAIGVVAATGEISTLAIFLFTVQFFWQFPHFWAIAWLSDEDYKKAGFYLLPDKNGEKTPMAGLLSFVFNIAILLSCFLAYSSGEVSVWCFAALMVASAQYAWKGYSFYKKCDRDSARGLMFSSFIHLPITLLAVFFDKIF